MNRCRGYSTLLITSVIVIMALVIGFSSYRSMFQYYRMVEHRLVSLKDDWQAEGVLECVFAQSKVGSLFPLDISECGTGLDNLQVTGQVIKQVKASQGFTFLERKFTLPKPDTSGAIKTSSNLEILYDSHFDPDPNEQNDDLEWKCVSVRYKGVFVAPSVTTYHPYELDSLPYSGFPSSTESQQRCASEYHSLMLTSAEAKSDFYQDLNLEPFRDLFGQTASQWYLVFSNPSVGRVPLEYGDLTSIGNVQAMPIAGFNSHCGEDIRSRVEQGYEIIWVYGGCELNDGDVASINAAIQNSLSGNGVILVVHNGVLAVNSKQRFIGLVMQFTSPESTFTAFSDWSATSIESDVTDYVETRETGHSVTSAEVSYFQVGRFNPLGGLMLASTGKYGVIKGQINFHYQRDLVRHALSYIRPVHWINGSWSERSHE